MTQNKRIFLNITATYGRSLYSLIVGLFTARWVLMALGQTDFGLFGLVGGLVGFVAFLNGVLGGSVGRFYAVSVGAAKKVGNEKIGLEECRKWFNTAISVHSVVPFILIVIGYPLGIWAVENFLTIPVDRIIACRWVWRFSCVSCFVGMFTVPFQAMYIAKQEIAELTIYSFASTTLNAIMLFYMASRPGDWLAKYAAWRCLITIAPQLVIAVRATLVFNECRFRRQYLFDRGKFAELLNFSVARFWSSLSNMLVGQGQGVLVNKYMGPKYNASMSLGTTVANQASMLSASLSGAFWPAISNKAGEGKTEEARRLCFVTCKFGTILMLIFAIPLMLEVHEVLRLWLVNPPDFAAEICMAVLIKLLLEHSVGGYYMIIYGLGHGVMSFSFLVGCAGLCVVGVAWVLFAFGLGMKSIVWALILSEGLAVFVRLICGRKYAGLSIRHWLRKIAAPILTGCVISLAIGWLPSLFMPPSVLRIGVTTVASDFTFIVLVWFWLCDSLEREFIASRVRRFLHLQGGLGR